MTLQEQTIIASKAKENNRYDRHDHELIQVSESYLNDVMAGGFVRGAEWERQREKWISVKDRWPEYLQPVTFVVDFPGNHRHGKVYAGTFTGNPNDSLVENSFSTPGCTMSASYWMPSPEPPKQKEEA